jgi:hypothetical protein
MIILLLWGVWRYLKNAQVEGSYLGALVIAESLIIIQGALGIVLFISGFQPERGWMHILYGIVGALGIPLIFVITKGQISEKGNLLFVSVLLLNIVLIFRSFATG